MGGGGGTSKETLCKETAPEKRLQVTIYMEAKLMTYWYKPWLFWGYQCFVDSFEGTSLIPERLYLCMYVFIIYLFIYFLWWAARGMEKKGKNRWGHLREYGFILFGWKKNYFVAWTLGSLGVFSFFLSFLSFFFLFFVFTKTSFRGAICPSAEIQCTCEGHVCWFFFNEKSLCSSHHWVGGLFLGDGGGQKVWRQEERAKQRPLETPDFRTGRGGGGAVAAQRCVPAPRPERPGVACPRPERGVPVQSWRPVSEADVTRSCLRFLQAIFL